MGLPIIDCFNNLLISYVGYLEAELQGTGNHSLTAVRADWLSALRAGDTGIQDWGAPHLQRGYMIFGKWLHNQTERSIVISVEF